MKVLLVASNTERISMVTPPYGLGLVAGALREAGHDVTFLDLLDSPDPDTDLRRTVAEGQPEVIGISVRNIDDQNAREPRFLLEKARGVVAACREASPSPIVLGGPGYSLFPREALAYLGADYGIRGDGERAFQVLLERLDEGRDPRGIPGIQVAGDPAPATLAAGTDFTHFPAWAEDLQGDPEDPDFWVPLQSRRGCPNDCSYCSTASIQGRDLRCRSPRQVLDTIDVLAHRGYRRFYFVDNAFNHPESLALDICRGLRGFSPRLAWRCILYPSHVGEPLVHAMAAAGCVEVALGFESGSPRILKEMNKHFTPEEVRACAALLAAYGIRRMGFLLLGGPGETRETVEESLAFARSLRLDGLKATVGLRIYPGTALARRAIAEGVISEDDDLLRPKFYLAPGLEPWIHARVAAEGL